MACRASLRLRGPSRNGELCAFAASTPRHSCMVNPTIRVLELFTGGSLLSSAQPIAVVRQVASATHHSAAVWRDTTATMYLRRMARIAENLLIRACHRTAEHSKILEFVVAHRLHRPVRLLNEIRLIVARVPVYTQESFKHGCRSGRSVAFAGYHT
jgi:hypothetical protein